MAENTTSTTTNNTTTTTATRKPAAAKRKPAARKPSARRATTRTTPSRTTGRRVRTQARNETREAMKAQERAARISTEQFSSLAERAALSYVGATLESRDRVIEAAGSLAGTFGSPKAAERESTKVPPR